MFKINLTGGTETVRLSEDAGLECRPRDLETLHDVMQAMPDEDGDGPSLNNIASALANEVVEGWFGLVDEDGQVIKFAPDLVSAVMSDPIVVQAFRDQYFNRLLYLRDEGNDSTPSQNGTSGAAKTTAKGARQTARTARTKRKPRAASKAAKSGG